MSQPTPEIYLLARKLRKHLHTYSYALHHVVAHAKAVGYPTVQARQIVQAVFFRGGDEWRSWGG